MYDIRQRRHALFSLARYVKKVVVYDASEDFHYIFLCDAWLRSDTQKKKKKRGTSSAEHVCRVADPDKLSTFQNIFFNHTSRRVERRPLGNRTATTEHFTRASHAHRPADWVCQYTEELYHIIIRPRNGKCKMLYKYCLYSINNYECKI